MLISIRRIGNSHGVIIPRLLLEQAGLEHEVDLTVEDDTIILRKPARPVRQGWAEASARIASTGDDVLVMPDFTNEGDKELVW